MKVKLKNKIKNKTKNKTKNKAKNTRKSISKKILSGGFSHLIKFDVNPYDGPDVGIDTTHENSAVNFYENSFNKNRFVRESHNCYTYFLNMKNQEAVDKCKKDLDNKNICSRSQPGYYSGHDYLNESDYKCPVIMKRTLDDNQNILPLSIQDSQKPCPKGFYKGALVVAPGRDYHYYRQDDDLNGRWSHKPGYKPSTNKDSKGEDIYDPRTASRDYGGTLNYKDFCGYMCVPRNNRKKNMAHKGSKLQYINRIKSSYGGKNKNTTQKNKITTKTNKNKKRNINLTRKI